MTTKSIFYSSNSHIDIFPKNNRCSFMSQIDHNELGYIRTDNITAAIKNITFENKFDLVSHGYGEPDMILIQDNGLNSLELRVDELTNQLGSIDIKSGKDYYFFSGGDYAYGVGRIFDLANFTDIKLFCEIKNPLDKSETVNNFVSHNIYFHETNFNKIKDLLAYLNYVWYEIESDLPFTREDQTDVVFSLDANSYCMISTEKNRFSSVFFHGGLALC